jgi:hypothetical protein
MQETELAFGVSAKPRRILLMDMNIASLIKNL